MKAVGQMCLTAFVVFTLYLSVQQATAQTANNPCKKSTEGTDFWFAFMEGREQISGHYVEITLSSAEKCNYTIRIGGSDVVSYSGVLAPNSPKQIKLDWEQVEAMGSEEIQKKAINLKSDKPMNVYALNYCESSSDVALIFPTPALGKEYYAICYEPHYNEYEPGKFKGKNSEFLIVATENNTKVTITPSKVTDKGNQEDVDFTVVLNQGEVYQVQSLNTVNAQGQGDLTGSHIESDKPIAVFSGSLATTVPNGGNVRAWNHLFEQVPPVHAWGRKFMAVPFKSRSVTRYRIMAAYDNTIVNIDGSAQTINYAGDFIEFELQEFSPAIVVCNKPSLLAQYSCSYSVDEQYTGGNGDPFMIIVSPLNQTKQDVSFVAYNSKDITDLYFVDIIAADTATTYIWFDDKPIFFDKLTGTGYSYTQMPIRQGGHQIMSRNPNVGFIAYVYGFGNYDSFGYGAGFNLDLQLDIGGNAENDTLTICKGSEIEINAGEFFDNYLWSNGEKVSFITAKNEGYYWVKASTNEGCELKDSVYLSLTEPEIFLGNDTMACKPGEIILDAGRGFTNYIWQNGSTRQTCSVDSTGVYWVAASDLQECQSTDSIFVRVFTPTFTQNYDVATDLHPEIAFTNQTEDAVSFHWFFGDGAESNDENPSHTFTQIGNYKVVMEAVSDVGCINSDSSMVKIVPFEFKAPNAFRPESMFSENREFIPVSVGIDASNYLLRIFNRSGSEIFRSTDPVKGWKGIQKNGKEAGQGVYVWTVDYLDVQGFRHKGQGSVMLVR